MGVTWQGKWEPHEPESVHSHIRSSKPNPSKSFAAQINGSHESPVCSLWGRSISVVNIDARVPTKILPSPIQPTLQSFFKTIS